MNLVEDGILLDILKVPLLTNTLWLISGMNECLQVQSRFQVTFNDSALLQNVPASDESKFKLRL